MLTCTTDINRQKYKNNTCILELKKGDCKTKKKNRYTAVVHDILI